MAAKRIYQIAKEFECEEKKIIDFLTAQGIKVSNRLSAVSDETYNLLKEKLFAPPPPPPEPEPQPKPQPKPQPAAEQAAPTTPAPADQTGEAPAQGKKKKKKKNKKPQGEEVDPDLAELEEFKGQPVPFMSDGDADEMTKAVYASAITAGNDFINNYVPTAKRRKKAHLARGMDTWQLMQDIIIEDPDASPICYWQAVNKLTTKGYRILQEYGLKNRELLAEMREFIKPVGMNYEPQEIFTDEENQKFETQQRFMFMRFGHGMGKVNDNLYELKMHAERKKAYCEHMSFVDYLMDPDCLLETKIPMPFNALAEAMAYSIRSVVFHVDFYKEYKELIGAAIENFFAWKDGYKQLKEQGAPADKLEKYFKLMEKLFNLIEFFSFDNLVYVRKNQPAPFLTIINYLNEYRDNMDDPDAERNFKYKVRGLASILYKPKEYIFLYQFGELEPHKDYRTPEMIAEYEAKKAAKAAEKAAAEAEAAAQAQADSAEKENPAAQSDEA